MFWLLLLHRGFPGSLGPPGSFAASLGYTLSFIVIYSFILRYFFFHLQLLSGGFLHFILELTNLVLSSCEATASEAFQCFSSLSFRYFCLYISHFCSHNLLCFTGSSFHCFFELVNSLSISSLNSISRRLFRGLISIGSAKFLSSPQDMVVFFFWFIMVSFVDSRYFFPKSL